ncbi:MAG: hypothetical protein HWQ43_13150 [Nostoc sp. JL31]|uniref:hypothetical protein n=1 Tax=Nostoc sp. JL31 TaxID=2815395 RepID=UPI0025D0475A|nr:hypothetical protein [Nostoc sp. JL31]MBN3890069.1 hypothetical protein [Nostoc sp. JL31]
MSETIDKFSRQDLFELLGEKYAPVKIIAGLQELAKSDPDINQRPATIQDLKNLTRSLLSEKFQSPA